MTIPECPTLPELYRKVFGDDAAEPSRQVPPRQSGLSDDEIIEKAKAAKNGDNFSRLWGGDTSQHHGDKSAADEALCSILAFWTRDPEQIDRLFRRSGLCRDKWTSRKDYRDVTIANALEVCKETYGGKMNGGEGQSNAALMLSILADDKLTHDASGTPFATIQSSTCVDGSTIVRPDTVQVGTARYERYARQKAYQHGLTLPDQSINAVVAQMKARAEFEGEQRPVFVRAARHGQNIFIDRNDPTGEAVEITPAGFGIIKAPVLFRRPSGSLELPRPDANGSFDGFFDLFGIRDDADRIKIIAWLICAHVPGAPCPLLSIASEQGSGKSVLANALSLLIDPQAVSLIGLPANELALAVVASNLRVLAVDNVSNIRDEMSDALCRVITGAGLKDRQFFSQSESVAFLGMLPILITSIGEVVTRPDLRERAMVVSMRTIPPEQRRTEAEIWADFERLRPAVLGAIYKAVSVGLANLPVVSLPTLPRMADFAKLVVAAEPALPWKPGRFMEVYQSDQRAADEAALENSVIGPLLLEMLEARNGWKGTMQELLAELRQRDYPRGGHGLPYTPRGLASAVARIKAALKAAGWKVCDKPVATNKGNVYTIVPVR